MKLMSRALLASVAVVALATPASAVTYLFTLSGGLTGSWQLPASPVPDVVFVDAFRINSVSGILNGNPFTDRLEFFVASEGGGVLGGNGVLFDLYGDQLFTGTTAAPTFKLGSFNLTAAPGDTGLPVATLTISRADAGIPEPATWAMMIAGFGLVGTGLRRRRAVVAA